MAELSSGMLKLSDKIYVSIFSLVALTLFFISQGFVYSLLFILSATLHETAHLLFLSLYGAKITKIVIFPFGIDICADTMLLSYKKELVCTLAGSLANLLFALLGCLLMNVFPSPQLLFFVLCNVFLGILNLIPLSFFDGGKALRLILYDCLEIDRAFYIHKGLDILSALVFLCFALFAAACSSFNFSVCVVIVYAALSTFALYKKRPHTS